MTKFSKRIWGWMFFDWACQPYFTLLLTFVFAPYFTSAVVGDGVLGQQYWGWMLTIVGLCIACLAPILGAIADGTGARTIWIVICTILMAGGSFALWWALPGSSAIVWPLVAVGLGLIGAEISTIFVNAMLPSLGSDRDIGVISGSGWAFGYLGGILSLAIMLLFLAENESGKTLLGQLPAFGLDVTMREGTRSVGPFTALWLLIFLVPFFLWTRSHSTPPAKNRTTLQGLLTTIRGLPQQKSLFAYLGSSMFYRDGLNGLFAFGGIYAAGVLQWSIVQIGVFGVASLVFGTFCAWIGGYADRTWGSKLVIAMMTLVLIGVCTLIFTTNRDMVALIPVAPDSSLPDLTFYVCGCIIGGAGGVLQATSRTMMVNQANPERMSEAFGLYAFAGKATSFLAPFLIATMTGLTGDQRLGVTPLILLFVIGLILLHWVQPRKSLP